VDKNKLSPFVPPTPEEQEFVPELPDPVPAILTCRNEDCYGFEEEIHMNVYPMAEGVHAICGGCGSQITDIRPQ
jgi:aspartate carbamoyltransferase regulatory subunit